MEREGGAEEGDQGAQWQVKTGAEGVVAGLGGVWVQRIG